MISLAGSKKLNKADERGRKQKGRICLFSLFFPEMTLELRVVNLARSNEMHILYGAGIKIPL